MPAPLLTRDELLSRLCQTFRRYGYEGASMTRIAVATGLGKASLYHHFPEGKAQMAAAVVDSVRGWFEMNVFRPLEGVHPPRQRLISMLETLNRYYENGQLGCLPAMFALAEERDMLAEPINQFFARWVGALAQTLADAGLARDIARRRAEDGVERIQGALVVARATANTQLFIGLAAELPDQLLAGGDRSTLWTSRAPRFPAPPTARPLASRAG